jgi:threonine/homoserine/homoserine lactone efflux protein
MDAGNLIGKASALLVGLMFLVLATLIWIGFAGLGTYPVAFRLVFGVAILAYGGWRARRAWAAAGSGREN